MVAHAALVSLRQTLDSIPHSGRRISHNRAQVKSLHEKVSFLLDFLENYSCNYGKRKDPELDGLETMVRKAAYNAADVVESDISNQLLAQMEAEGALFLVLLCVLLCVILCVNFPAAVAFQIWSRVFFLPVMCVFLTALQSLLPVNFSNVIFVIARILIPLWVHILVPFLILSVMAAVAGYVIHEAVISFAARYWLYAHQPENQDLLRAIDDISFVMNEAIKIKDECLCGEGQPQHFADGLFRRDFRGIGKNVVVGLDSYLNEIYARMLGYPSELQILSIVGMGGIGKTTLARQVYRDPRTVYHFDICAWVTVSQEYSFRQVLSCLLDSARIGTEEVLKNHKEGDGDLDHKLGEYLYKNLMSRRYLIVVDDTWDTKIWDFVRSFFPDNHNGSRVLLTSRLSEVASYADSSTPPLQMQFLNYGDSWHLLREKVFEGEDCPLELEAIGKTIVQNCGGLPLAIVVVGGLLYNEHRTEQDWRRVSKNLNSILSKDDDQCLEILGLSYDHLPHRLKPCFLYMGAFPEDEEIGVTRLFNLWAAEGFLEASESKTMEELAEEYLKDLIQRSLVMVGKWSCNGKIRTCKIHDLLRDVCLLNGHKENFLDFANEDWEIGDGGGAEVQCIQGTNVGGFANPFIFAKEIDHGGAESQRRLSTHVSALARFGQRSSYSTVRSLICFGKLFVSLPSSCLGFRLLRVLDIVTNGLYEFPDEIYKLVLLRYLGLTYDYPLPPSISRLWNLQTLVFYNGRYGTDLRIPVEIWSMQNLRHLYFTTYLLPDPPVYQLLRNSSVLENLQTLVGISDFRCTKGVLKSIPNLKKLGISYDVPISVDWSEYELESLVNLHKLETLKISVEFSTSVMHPPKLAFPQTLIKLSLSGCRLPWESMTTVGALPSLQVLKLRNSACKGQIWELVEGEFPQLMFLLLEDSDLEHWRSNETHFPRLQRLILRRCNKLQQVPCGMGEIPTLESMELVDCHPSAVASAKQIQEEQQSMGNEDLKIHIEETYFDHQM